MKELDDINRELAEIIEELNDTPDDDFARRHTLRTKQDKLRAAAAEFAVNADSNRSAHDLEAELRSLEARRAAIFDSGIDLVTQAGGGSGTGGSFTSAGEGALNPKIRESSGIVDIDNRIAKVRQELASRSGEEE